MPSNKLKKPINSCLLSYKKATTFNFQDEKTKFSDF